MLVKKLHTYENGDEKNYKRVKKLYWVAMNRKNIGKKLITIDQCNRRHLGVLLRRG